MTIQNAHRLAATLAFLIILTFFSSTLIAELLGNDRVISATKHAIVYGIWLLVPVMALTGITGMKLAPKASSGPIGRKKKRMPIIALNGLLILIPAAIYLDHLASQGLMTGVFWWVQGLELTAGAANLILMGLNVIDGRRLRPRSRC
ncbi:hypothetical protein [Ferrimonas sp. SCSIO 43195]|uniref:hypothetical protein n=1 Tax=Ferrimonas sp. SCSIO 43195 TaxID=2822844 RepID=UPI002075DD99|nr:hypothetical protein [Ferrimonas sp. SCSIO 43195]USD39228.1 hypothetical protein J8Z22_09055 [Ferrimonas sp. SCSIO 43195]